MTKTLEKRIKKLVEKTTRQLRWPVEYVYDDSQTVQMVIRPRETKYIITLPKARENLYEFFRLHELGHALFYEKYEVGANLAPLKTDRERACFDVLLPIVRTVDDWFLEPWLRNLVPEAAAEDTELTVRAISAKLKNKKRPVSIDFGSFIELAGITAQSIKFYNYEVNTSEDLQRAVDVFLSVSPFSCSIENTEKLANKLLEQCRCGFRVKATRSEGNLNWDYTYGEETERSAVRSASAPSP